MRKALAHKCVSGATTVCQDHAGGNVDNGRDDESYRTERQREWAAWAAHGYRKLYQPRSIRRFGAIFYGLLALFLLLLFWFTFSEHRLPW